MSNGSAAESARLSDAHHGRARWMQWGPYVSDRAWGTVREDYSPDGTAWSHLPHDHARSKAYRWGEDGIGGISDDRQYLCFALALWNGRDPILKERLFGLGGGEGNHGEDVKEYYFYLDGTPTHSYMKMLYKYPHAEFPYTQLVEENRRRGLNAFEFELLDTGVFDENAYFDVTVEYAKHSPSDILIRISAVNRGSDRASLMLLPTLWFRNTWSWGYDTGPMKDVPGKPSLTASEMSTIRADHPVLGPMYLYADGLPELIFTENETNAQRLYGLDNPTPHVKDSFHRYVIDGDLSAINPDRTGTKAAARYALAIGAGETATLQLRLTSTALDHPFEAFGQVFRDRIAEANAFYDALHRPTLSTDARQIQRQALAGMLWNKQLYYYDVEQWLAGDPIAEPPQQRKSGRSSQWTHLNNFDILSMPDKWEYPWYAGWDLAFHCIPLAMVDAEFAKAQILLLTREWYMHPNGQLPAYEWAFGDVNPPVHAWAALHIYRLDGRRDTVFLKRVFNKMLLNFTWWVNRKDAEGRNIFQGGFLGLDNISLFDRSSALPLGGHIDQSDGTAWMGFYCLEMMKIALELAKSDPPYEDMAIKFYEHFLWIALAIGGDTRDGVGLWDAEDGFYYDVLKIPGHRPQPLRVRSLVGLMPLIAVETVSQKTLDRFPAFATSIRWLCEHRPDLARNLASTERLGKESTHLFAMVSEDQLRRVLSILLDEREFLSPYGIRSLSKSHDTPYEMETGGQRFSIRYEPAESSSNLFGGNSNWRGPIWFPINYLLIEALRKHARFYGDGFKLECPTGSGVYLTLDQIADDLGRRLVAIFLRNDHDVRPVYGGQQRFQTDPHWRDSILFHEYFHGENGAGLGASHQTGWTGLVATLLSQCY
ncbi:MAG: glucosidase [Chloroflexi bacterium]|nr:glucosidase [Chloroflexota bacterium]